MGQWYANDPIGFDGGDWNLYRFVGNNVVNRQDPTGMVAINPRTGCYNVDHFNWKCDNKDNYEKLRKQLLLAFKPCFTGGNINQQAGVLATVMACIAVAESSLDYRTKTGENLGYFQIDSKHYDACTKKDNLKPCDPIANIDAAKNMAITLCSINKRLNRENINDASKDDTNPNNNLWNALQCYWEVTRSGGQVACGRKRKTGENYSTFKSCLGAHANKVTIDKLRGLKCPKPRANCDGCVRGWG